MTNGIREFLFSAGIVTAGLATVWAWPAFVEGGGMAGLLERSANILRDSGVRAATIPDKAAPATASKDETPPSGPVVARDFPAQCDTVGGASDAVVIGDRVQLRLFEASTLAGAGADAPGVDIVFERLDLSGAYEVGGDGSLSLPAIGHVEVAGSSLPCVEALVSRTAFDRLRSDSTVTASFAARPPVLVRGAVRNPGSHPFRAGLDVDHLLTQAGAFGADDPASAARIAVLEARRDELEIAHAGLALERLRITAAMDGRKELTADARSLDKAAALLGEGRIEAEQAALAADGEARELRAARLDGRLHDLDARIDAAQRQLENAEEQYGYFDERRTRQADFLRNGTITGTRLEATEIRAMEALQLLLQRQDILLQLQAERRLVANEIALADAERQSGAAAELRNLAAREAAVASEFRAVMAELSIIGGSPAGLEVTIERPTGADSIQTIAARPDTPLRPGDLVVVAAPATDAAAAHADLGAAMPETLLRSAFSR